VRRSAAARAAALRKRVALLIGHIIFITLFVAPNQPPSTSLVVTSPP